MRYFSDRFDVDGVCVRVRLLIASPMSGGGLCAAMDRMLLADITPGPGLPGNRPETRMESLRRRRAGAEWPRPKMARAFIRAPMGQTVTRRPTAMAAIDVLELREIRLSDIVVQSAIRKIGRNLPMSTQCDETIGNYRGVGADWWPARRNCARRLVTTAGRAVSAVGGVGGAGTYRRSAVGGEQRAVLGDWESFSESCRGRSVGVERPGRDVHGGIVIRRQHESSAFQRYRYAERLCGSTCDRYPHLVRHQRRDLEDSRGREFALGSQHALRRALHNLGADSEQRQNFESREESQAKACATSEGPSPFGKAQGGLLNPLSFWRALRNLGAHFRSRSGILNRAQKSALYKVPHPSARLRAGS